MATKSGGPSQLGSANLHRAHYGVALHTTYKGKDVVRSWPRKRGPGGTPAQLAARERFAFFASAFNDVADSEKMGARLMAEGTGYTWRDVLMRTMCGRFFLIDGVDAMEIQDALDTISTAIGVLLVRTEAGWLALSPGDAGEVLTANGADQLPSYQAGGGGGGGAWSLISTKVASSSSALEWTNLTAASAYMLEIRQLIPATDGANMLVQIGSGGAPTWKTTGYTSAVGTRNSVAGSNTASGSTGQILSALGVDNVASAGGCSGTLRIFGLSAAAWKQFLGTVSVQYSASSTIATGGDAIGVYTADTNVYDALRIIASTGNLASGEASLYAAVT